MIDLVAWAFATIVIIAVAVGITVIVLFRKERKAIRKYKRNYKL